MTENYTPSLYRPTPREERVQRSLEDELCEVHAACMEHVRIRNEQAERIRELERALIDLMRYAGTVETHNEPEWIEGLCSRLNDAAKIVAPDTVFVWHKSQDDGSMWITTETIP